MIRVLRVLEYEYENAEEAIRDQERWGVPANGLSPRNYSPVIRSVTMPMQIVEDSSGSQDAGPEAAKP